MIDNTKLNNQNNPSEVLQKYLTRQVINIVDSEDNLNKDFYLVFNEIEKEDRKEFLDLFIDWIKTKKFKLFFDEKYNISLKDGNRSFKYSYLELGRAELEDPLFINGLRDRKDLKYPATEYWIERKTWELQQLIPELNNLQKQLFESFDEVDLNSEVYSFPKSLIDDEFDSELIQSFRIPVNSSLENLKQNLQPELDDLMSCFDEVTFNAFLYNSFNFKENPTKPTPLKINYPTKINKGIFKAKIYRLYRKFDTNYGYLKKEFMKIMILNFSKHRTPYLDDNFDFNKHLSAVEKSVKNL